MCACFLHRSFVVSGSVKKACAETRTNSLFFGDFYGLLWTSLLLLNYLDGHHSFPLQKVISHLFGKGGKKILESLMTIHFSI